MSQQTISKEEVLGRLRETFCNAVKDRTGVSFFLSQEEQNLVSEADVQKLQDETGYTAMLSEPVVGFVPRPLVG